MICYFIRATMWLVMVSRRIVRTEYLILLIKIEPAESQSQYCEFNSNWKIFSLMTGIDELVA
jgi:hypothetical protein